MQAAFVLTRLPLVRWTLVRFSEEEHLLIHVEHHLTHDGWSFNVFLGELLELYGGFSLGIASSLAAPRIQFKDFAFWQREWMGSEEAERQRAYWMGRLVGCPPLLELPYRDRRPAGKPLMERHHAWN